ncbi:MAG: NAD-dependent epimerase/dehydratase family protein [Thaumarchaeota archaeon]|nr:NAD-dependent epimerase/dehydratase family protein [Nitrososphaerota archaeon]
MRQGRKVLVTGVAGFIGSQTAEALISRGYKVIGLDNLRSGSLANMSALAISESFEFVRADLLTSKGLGLHLAGVDAVMHLAANPDVRSGITDTKLDYEQNVHSTFNLLEGMRKSGVRRLVFASTSTVYGAATALPTPEDYGPLKPISLYGASKLACESLVSGFSHSFGFESASARMANIVGPRSRHGIIPDFMERLATKPNSLQILGDGTQSKSYLHVDDCINALVRLLEKSRGEFEAFNVGSDDRISVLEIAGITFKEMGLKDVEILTGRPASGGGGWVGDVKTMLLDVRKLKALGWKPRHRSAAAVRQTVRARLGRQSGRGGREEVK